MGRRTEALAAIARAVELNPYNARPMSGGLPMIETFESLRSDPEWTRIMSVWPLANPAGG